MAALLGVWKAAADGTGGYPIRRRKKVEMLYKSPDGNPIGLEATKDGLWVGEQITDRAYLVEWETGRPLVKHETQSSNTSGIAAGNGFEFMAANGPAILRPRRPHDIVKGGRIVKLDGKTGEHIINYQTPNGGGLHGLLCVKDSLWVTQFGPNKIVQADADLNLFHDFDVPLNRPHGLGWDGEHIWSMFSNDYTAPKFEIRTGRVLEAVQLDRSDPDPHGMTWWDGALYHCDAGIAPGHKDSLSKHAGSICRIHLQTAGPRRTGRADRRSRDRGRDHSQASGRDVDPERGSRGRCQGGRCQLAPERQAHTSQGTLPRRAPRQGSGLGGPACAAA